MAENSPGSQKLQILGLGVTAFSALCTVLAALITAGFFVGRVTASSAKPAVTVTVTATPGGSQPSSAPHANGGTVIGQFTDFALSSGYGIHLGPGGAPQPDQTYTSDDLGYERNGIEDNLLTGSGGQLATLGSGTPSYETCKRDTAYANTIYQVSTNQVVCFTGHGVIAALTIKKVVDGPTFYIILDVTVWQAS
jgi:hypothetical protein